MRKRILALALSMAMVLGLAWQPAFAASGAQPGNQAHHWFYNQLDEQPRAQMIYRALEEAYTKGALEDGMTKIALANVDVEAYLKGNRSLFNDFSAAKDAFDLEHPEAWYFDSAQLSLNAVEENGSAKAFMGVGRSDTYYVMGVKDASDVEKKTLELEKKVTAIADKARGIADTYERIKYVHDQVIDSISYKYEFECVGNAVAGITQAESAGAIRTAYALVTGEGVCEGYVRSFQMILNELGIPCVPIHGTQTSNNDPQHHMWCAVRIDDEKSSGWYVVDPTWDDPLPDGNERDDYFMVGNDKIAAEWIPSGHVSTGPKEFTYPSIAPRSYGAGEIEFNGLAVTYEESVMENVNSMAYRVSYNGMGVYQAAKEGYHLLVKLHDINADGSEDGFEDWYYLYNSLYIVGGTPGVFDPSYNLQNTGNPYHYDTDSYVVEEVSNCEYVEFAVTKLPPKLLETKDFAELEKGYLKDSGGSEKDIIAQTGMIYNPNGDYEQRPWVKNVSPSPSEPTYVGATHTIHMEFTDPLYHPDQKAVNNAAAIGKVNEAEDVMYDPIGVDYTGENHSWGMNGGLPHTFAEPRPEPKNVRWYCAAVDENGKEHGVHADMSKIGSACRLTTLEFEFTPSVMWADDSVAYQFFVTGLVGAKSNKKPERTGMSFVFENNSCAICYRCPCLGGIDWNLWGQPQLLDDPNDLARALKVEGGKTVAELYGSISDQINRDPYDMNGRLLLVVEDAGSDKKKSAAMSEQLEKKSVDLQKAVASALYEIDFARICGKTVVATGQSLRMQVGFPAGFDASNLGTTEFKVYHFKKDTNGNIIGVEPIPVTVTPYGLVFVVNSFSPFAIVAEELPDGKKNDSRSVVLVSSGHGKITSNYRLGTNDVEGSLKLSSGDSYEITITPDSDYAVESITATGFNGSYNVGTGGGTFTLSYGDIGETNAMIGVTFVKVESGKTPAPVEPVSLCAHTNVTSTGGTPVTCTEDGKAPTVTCTDCKQVLSGGETIQHTGHVYKKTAGYQEPTCETAGDELTCTVCGKEKSQAPALGHAFKDGACVRKGCNVHEPCTVIFDPDGGEIASGSKSEIVIPADSKLTKDKIPNATWSGHTLKGWYLAQTPTEKDPEATGMTVTRNITLYAEWSDGSTGGNDNPGGGSGGGNTGGGTTGGDNTGGGSTGGGTTGGDNTGGGTSRPSTGGNTPRPSTGGSSASSGGTTTKTETAKDGTVTTTVTDSKAGTSTVTVKRPDGSVSETKTDASGNISRQETFANGVKVSTEVPSRGSASASVTIPAGMKSASVTIQAPVTAGTVAVDKATGRVIMLSIPVDGGLKVVLDGSANIVLANRAMTFNDMPGSHWAADSVDFVTAHGLFYGMENGKFGPNAHMTRAMLMTVLARFNSVNTELSQTWYGPGMEWAVANGISDGTNLHADITREQLATMLYRYAGSPAVSGAVSGYPDADKISGWAASAMRWAVQNGIIEGSNGYLNPGGSALRSEVSAMIERFCRNVAVG